MHKYADSGQLPNKRIKIIV